jgi:hypothetical protein
MRKLIAVAVAGAVALVVGGCTPDTTRGRVEQDFAQTFTNQYAQSLQRQGKPVARPKVVSTVCHNGTNQTPDALGCYQAFTQDDKLRYRQIRDVYSHKLILDPAGSFDGCLDVYAGPTNTSKK